MGALAFVLAMDEIDELMTANSQLEFWIYKGELGVKSTPPVYYYCSDWLHVSVIMPAGARNFCRKRPFDFAFFFDLEFGLYFFFSTWNFDFTFFLDLGF